MRKGDYAELTLKKILQKGAELTGRLYECEVLQISDAGEVMYVLLKNGLLEELSLDGIYWCRVKSEGSEESCTVRIKERFIGPKGKTLKMKIENGIYKINVKSVDKQIV